MQEEFVKKMNYRKEDMPNAVNGDNFVVKQYSICYTNEQGKQQKDYKENTVKSTIFGVYTERKG